MFSPQIERSTLIYNMDFNKKEFKKLVDHAHKIVEGWYSQHLRGKKIYYNKSPNKIYKTFDIDLKNKAENPFKVLEYLEKNLLKNSNFNPSPNYYGYITGGGNQIGILGEFIKSALNQNNLKWHSAPANSEMEKIVVRWVANFIGYTKKCGGVLVSGGSVANLMNIAVMRKIKGNKEIKKQGVYGHKKMIVYVSQEAHSSIDKAMDILGLGSENLIKIKTDYNFKINTQLLKKRIKYDLKKGNYPIGIIGIAGTTNTGSVDPLEELSKISSQNNLWFMVDAAYGGPAASLNSHNNLFKGMEKADSILINPHKWLFVPFEVACVLVKNKDHLKKTFSFIPEYLLGGTEFNEREDLMNYNIQLSKDFKALKVWMTIKTYGYHKIKQAIKNDIKMASYAYDKVCQDSRFEPINNPELSILCFKYKGETKGLNDSSLNKKITDMIEEDGRVFLSGTIINNENVLRINCINHRRKKSDIDFLFEVLKEIGKKAEKELTLN